MFKLFYKFLIFLVGHVKSAHKDIYPKLEEETVAWKAKFPNRLEKSVKMQKGSSIPSLFQKKIQYSSTDTRNLKLRSSLASWIGTSCSPTT